MSELVVIGKVKGRHGHHGALKVLPLTDNPQRFSKLKRVFLSADSASPGKAYQVEKVADLGKYISLKLAEVDDMQVAWELNNYLVTLPVEEREPITEEGTYYISDLLGLEVVDEAGENLGKLVNIIETGAKPVFAIHKQGQELLLPAYEETIKKVDLENGVITVIPWMEADGD